MFLGAETYVFYRGNVGFRRGNIKSDGKLTDKQRDTCKSLHKEKPQKKLLVLLRFIFYR